ncbi:transmembrane receptor protein kinase [Vigna unguiculata]|uniref:Transmembrane receptor protein kinase n=1 Tax=Vigna unguiculata TaxID=3917 RepID=A0A4D6N5D7_VIGUN|nr:transmembrane receptor protein kinase [Vigna unguiculata]
MRGFDPSGGRGSYIVDPYKEKIESYCTSNRLTEKSDVYNFGVVLLEIITGQKVIARNEERGHIKEWVRSLVALRDIMAIVDSSTQNGDRDEFLLPEFNDLLKVVDFGVSVVRNSSKRNMEASWLKEYADPEKDDHEQEVTELRTMIRMLQDREQNLEVQLLEYCGLREQETAVMEIQNILKASTVEEYEFSKIFFNTRANGTF